MRAADTVEVSSAPLAGIAATGNQTTVNAKQMGNLMFIIGVPL
jgi:hypothetical protein